MKTTRSLTSFYLLRRILFLLAIGIHIPTLLSAADYLLPLKISENKRYLEDQAGRPFLYNADTGWKLFNKLEKNEVIEYLIDRKQKKFTVIQTMLTGFAGEINVFGVGPFQDINDFETLNAPYFDHVDWVIRQADSLNLVLAIAPLWAGCCREGYSGKEAAMSKNGGDKTYDFGEYLGSRYGSYSNIIWIIGGDNDPHEDKDTMRQLALGIKSMSPIQLMTYHAASTHSSSDVWEDENWIDIVMTYTYFRGFDKAWNKNQPDVYEVNFKEYQKEPIKPFFLGESTYEGMHDSWGSAVQARKQAYWSILAGGMGHAYGTPMWDFPTDWRTYLNLKGGNSMRHLYDLFHQWPWYRLIPDISQKIIAKGAGEYAGNDLAIGAVDDQGEFMVIYFPSGREFVIDLEGLKGNKIEAIWINPETYAFKKIEGQLNKDTPFSNHTPDNNDWVLILESRLP